MLLTADEGREFGMDTTIRRTCGNISPCLERIDWSKRAERQQETRRRIEATIALHEEIGGGTTITAIAERAGVSRLTVYRHFPDERACSRRARAPISPRTRRPTPALGDHRRSRGPATGRAGRAGTRSTDGTRASGARGPGDADEPDVDRRAGPIGPRLLRWRTSSSRAGPTRGHQRRSSEPRPASRSPSRRGRRSRSSRASQTSMRRHRCSTSSGGCGPAAAQLPHRRLISSRTSATRSALRERATRRRRGRLRRCRGRVRRCRGRVRRCRSRVRRRCRRRLPFVGVGLGFFVGVGLRRRRRVGVGVGVAARTARVRRGPRPGVAGTPESRRRRRLGATRLGIASPSSDPLAGGASAAGDGPARRMGRPRPPGATSRRARRPFGWQRSSGRSGARR